MYNSVMFVVHAAEIGLFILITTIAYNVFKDMFKKDR
jgi:hypothetical protein